MHSEDVSFVNQQRFERILREMAHQFGLLGAEFIKLEHRLDAQDAELAEMKALLVETRRRPRQQKLAE